MSNPTTRTLKYLRERGWLAEKTEQPWNPFSKVRKDLFGFVDILAVKGDESLYIQATDRTSVSKRIHKIVEHGNLPLVKSASRRVEVWGWGKGDREPRIEVL